MVAVTPFLYFHLASPSKIRTTTAILITPFL